MREIAVLRFLCIPASPPCMKVWGFPVKMHTPRKNSGFAHGVSPNKQGSLFSKFKIHESCPFIRNNMFDSLAEAGKLFSEKQRKFLIFIQSVNWQPAHIFFAARQAGACGAA